jgi:two-component system C4-dicarboxylate transport response regulator DctD
MGQSPSMDALRRRVLRLAESDTPVLIEGETGTGKELVAAALHLYSRRRGPFVPVNMAAVPESLFESQIFGHVRGAFSGALHDQRGLFDEASKGTILLDEVSSTPLNSQAKLLRTLESRSIRPIGARAERLLDVRIVAAANVLLAGEVDAGRFRADLFYRLCGSRVVLPPLRERREDIGLLAKHYATLAAHKRSLPISLTG